MRSAVLFDLDDTLFDHRGTSRAALAVIRDACPAFGAWSLEELEARHGLVLEALHRDVMTGTTSVDDAREERFRRLIADAGGTGRSPSPAAVARAYRDAYVTSGRPVAGARALLQAIRRHARVGIVSNNILSEQETKLERFGMRPFVDVLVVSAEEGVSKPAPNIFAAALARLGHAPREAVMVGDSWESDVLGAVGAGIPAIWLNRDGRSRPSSAPATEIAALEPTAVVAALILASSSLP
jgi:HAD superfamily hydrolase (TIGR01509 family)